ncbi:MAG: AAA family ATPase [Promethearchaeota archaeon]
MTTEETDKQQSKYKEPPNFIQIITDMKSKIVGNLDQIQLAAEAATAGLPLVIEGDVGTGKTELAKALSSTLNRPFYRVDGNDGLNALKLIGWFDPPLVLQKGFNEDTFIPGPLSRAMKEGGIFFFNETNRAPSECSNAVLSALDEKLLVVPKLGPIESQLGFTAIFTMNPKEHIATNPLPKAFYDRCIWISLDHLPIKEAEKIVQLRTECKDENLIVKVCRIVQETRKHEELEHGASVRGAIQMTQLLDLRQPCSKDDFLKVGISVLSPKIRLRSQSQKTKIDIIEEIVNKVLLNFKKNRHQKLADSKK